MLVENPFLYFPRLRLSRPIYNGFVYFGEPDTDPYTNKSKRIDVTYIGDDGVERLLDQPLRTSSGGVPTVNGEWVKVLINQDYSMTACGNNNQQIFHTPNSKSFDSNERITEDTYLSDGQVKVSLYKVKTDGLSFYISGNFVDRGKLFEGIDYSIVDDTSILLKNSFPAGSILSAMQNPLEGESGLALTRISRVKAVEDGYTLTNEDTKSLIVFDSATQATLNIPADLSVGVGVVVSNTDDGGVVVNTADTVRGSNELQEVTGQMMLLKFDTALWQSSERV